MLDAVGGHLTYILLQAMEVVVPRDGMGPLVEMLFTLEATRALFYCAVSERRLDSPVAVVQRARAPHARVQRSVTELTGEAMRICGGRAMLRRHPLEGTIEMPGSPR